jgi:hypothetical protein
LGGTGIGVACTGLGAGVGRGVAFSIFGSGFVSISGKVTKDTCTAVIGRSTFLKKRIPIMSARRQRCRSSEITTVFRSGRPPASTRSPSMKSDACLGRVWDVI